MACETLGFHRKVLRSVVPARKPCQQIDRVVAKNSNIDVGSLLYGELMVLLAYPRNQGSKKCTHGNAMMPVSGLETIG